MTAQGTPDGPIRRIAEHRLRATLYLGPIPSSQTNRMWRSEGEGIGMDLVEARSASRNDEGEWYDALRCQLVLSLLRSRNLRPRSVLDFGCGGAGVAMGLKVALPTARLAGYDPAIQEQDLTRMRADGLEGTATLTDLQQQAFDLVLVMDVLEHVSTPRDVLSDAIALVQPGGFVLLTVPAYRWLWSSHDEALGHVDRYTLPRLRSLSASAGSGWVERSAGYAFPSLLAGAAPVRLAERVTSRQRDHGSQMTDVSARLARALRRVGGWDLRLVGARSPAGLTCVQLLERARE